MILVQSRLGTVEEAFSRNRVVRMMRHDYEVFQVSRIDQKSSGHHAIKELHLAMVCQYELIDRKEGTVHDFVRFPYGINHETSEFFLR